MTSLPVLQAALSPELRSFALPSVQGKTPLQAIPYNELGALGALPPINAPTGPSIRSTPGVETGGGSFENALSRMVAEVNSKQTAAGEAMSGLLSGENVSLHQAVIAAEEASLSFHLMVEVRNKLLEGYQELMRMQV